MKNETRMIEDLLLDEYVSTSSEAITLLTGFGSFEAVMISSAVEEIDKAGGDGLSALDRAILEYRVATFKGFVFKIEPHDVERIRSYKTSGIPLAL